MNVPDQVLRLVETFDRNIHAYKGKKYNETQVRREFIDPFFIALGWDINNTQGLAEAYKDVIHEDSIRIGAALKAPDYCFRIGGTRKFFVEAKNPSINIKDDPHTAFQLRRYAWSAKLPLSILTDFEEFAVYDCRVKPLKTDRASTARTIYINYKEYHDRWDEIASIFSKDAVQKGSFDKYALSAKRKKGTAEVDTAFLAEIENWRDLLAHNIALRNTSLTNRRLNYAVQRTIDRIIFLRIAEDRGIEQYGQLQSLLNGQNTYPRLFTLFERADERYNSGLFHFTPEPGRPDYDDLSPTLNIDDKPLKHILRSLYYPDSPYAFSVLPAEILGQVYEQFLGKVITLTSGHRARIDDKPEVKKAGGVYYTPAYIVDYIVKNTVGKLLENKTLTSASKLKILDPACGSGSFLIGAYQYLLDWHLKYYTRNNPEKHTKTKEPRLYKTDRGELRLTVAERKRILINNIFGVDIDSQAVEVTKLSLLLKVLEGQKQLVLFHRERALPDLSNNIKCGNSLIGPDFYQNQQLTFFDEDEQYKINAFDWKTEFPKILNRKNPGFDAVIGNPPYRKERDSKALISDLKNSTYGKKYYAGKMDFWYFFLHRGIDFTKANGYISFIVPSYWLKSTGAVKLILHLKSKCSFADVVNFTKNKIFEKATGQHMIFVLQKNILSKSLTYQKFTENGLPKPLISQTLHKKCTEHSSIFTLKNNQIFIQDNKIDFESAFHSSLLKKLDDSSFILENKSRLFQVTQGIVEAPDIVTSTMAKKAKKTELTGHGVFVLSPEEFARYKFNKHESKLLKPYLRAAQVSRYYHYYEGHYVFYIGNMENKHILKNHELYPNIIHHLNKYKNFITSSNAPYGIHRTRKSCYFTSEKLLCPNMFNKPCFTYCLEECYVNFAFNLVISNQNKYSLKYLLGVLNSTVAAFWFNIHAKKRGINNDVGVAVMRYYPVPTIDFSDPKDKSRHDKMVSLVQTMLDLNKKLPKAKTAHEKTILQRQITATDNQIDKLVYELYDLTEEEIKIIEESTK